MQHEAPTVTEQGVKTLAQRIDDFEDRWSQDRRERVEERRRQSLWLRWGFGILVTMFLMASSFTINEWLALRAGVQSNAEAIRAQQDITANRRDHEVRIAVMESQFSRIEQALREISRDIRIMRRDKSDSE